MNTRSATITALGALAIAAVAVSQDSMEDWVMPEVKPAEHQLAPAFDPASVNMDAWYEASTPGEEHKMLDQLVGEWDVTQKLFVPGSPEPMTAKMTATSKWVLNGRHIQETIKGEMMGMPYEGMGVTSYDKYNGRYNFFWADTMSTSSMLATGFATADGGAIEAYGTLDEPSMGMRGKPYKMVVRAVDTDTHTFELHDLHIGGDNTMVMELTYHRRKK